MQLKILGSSSAGNCYILETDSTALVIECGVKFQYVKQALNFNLRKVAGAVVSHEHADHSKAVKDFAAAGINVYCSQGTKDVLNVSGHRFKTLTVMERQSIGEFTVMPFDVKHDCKEPFGFIINHPACGNVLFITDSYYVPHKFKNLNQILIEANYCNDIVERRLNEESIHGFVRDRVIKSHMSIQTCKDLLRANDLKAVNNIVLIHLSDGNSDAQSFKTQVHQMTGKNVHIAAKNMEIDLSKTPF